MKDLEYHISLFDCSMLDKYLLATVQSTNKIGEMKSAMGKIFLHIINSFWAYTTIVNFQHYDQMFRKYKIREIERRDYGEYHHAIVTECTSPAPSVGYHPYIYFEDVELFVTEEHKGDIKSCRR